MSPCRGWALLSGLLAPQLALAQAPPLPVSGQVVRVEHRCFVRNATVVRCDQDRFPATATGRLQASDGDTLRLLAPGDRLLVFPSASVDRLFVIHGQHGHFLAGAALGLLGGIGLGALLFSLEEERPCDYSLDVAPCGDPGLLGGRSVAPLLVGPIFGLMIGGAVGASIRSNSWRAVRFQGLRVGPGPGLSLRLATSLAFYSHQRRAMRRASPGRSRGLPAREPADAYSTPSPPLRGPG